MCFYYLFRLYTSTRTCIYTVRWLQTDQLCQLSTYKNKIQCFLVLSKNIYFQVGSAPYYTGKRIRQTNKENAVTQVCIGMLYPAFCVLHVLYKRSICTCIIISRFFFLQHIFFLFVAQPLIVCEGIEHFLVNFADLKHNFINAFKTLS